MFANHFPRTQKGAQLSDKLRSPLISPFWVQKCIYVAFESGAAQPSRAKNLECYSAARAADEI
jgi:hypothetical protein